MGCGTDSVCIWFVEIYKAIKQLQVMAFVILSVCTLAGTSGVTVKFSKCCFSSTNLMLTYDDKILC